ncbi:hypothetical protein SUGI_0471570 [Cryptomeria japonica]|nr:hypothetical protein SUGI_0471570 [Cryptomeria japonica]
MQSGEEDIEGFDDKEKQEVGVDLGLCEEHNHIGIFTIEVLGEALIDKTLLEDLDIICRFIGPRRDRKSIREWVCSSWKYENLINLMPKGFFTVIFITKANREHFAGRLMGSGEISTVYAEMGSNFDPLMCDPYESAIWIRLYNFPIEYWVEEFVWRRLVDRWAR